MSANAPLTEEQRKAVAGLRALYTNLLASLPMGKIESVEERAQLPDPSNLPVDVTVRVEIAPPSPEPHPLLPTSALKAPEHVPIYFYALRGNCTPPEPESAAELADTRVIFFIHGGGNITGHPTQPPFVQFYSQLLRGVAGENPASKFVLIAPSYRLATVPENAFPAGLQDIVAAYDYVLGKGYDASNIVVAGDSAGGNHAVVLTHLLLTSGRQAPSSVIAIAPASILSSDLMSDYAKAQAGNDILDPSTSALMTKAYVGDSDISLTDPLLRGSIIPFSASWPRTLILVGTADQLIDSSRELEKRLVAHNRPVELVEYLQRPHGWWVMPHIFPETVQDAVQKIARFIHH